MNGGIPIGIWVRRNICISLFHTHDGLNEQKEQKEEKEQREKKIKRNKQTRQLGLFCLSCAFLGMMDKVHHGPNILGVIKYMHRKNHPYP